MIPFMENVQYRKIYRDRKNISGYLGMKGTFQGKGFRGGG